jgi:hypothetical protein
VLRRKVRYNPLVKPSSREFQQLTMLKNLLIPLNQTTRRTKTETHQVIRGRPSLIMQSIRSTRKASRRASHSHYLNPSSLKQITLTTIHLQDRRSSQSQINKTSGRCNRLIRQSTSPFLMLAHLRTRILSNTKVSTRMPQRVTFRTPCINKPWVPWSLAKHTPPLRGKTKSKESQLQLRLSTT